MHVVTIVMLTTLAAVTSLGLIYLFGVGVVATLLVYEQSLVRANDLSRIKQAFDLNGYVGMLYLATTAAAIYVG
jgi:4-hydroxybenzoate polyprenyltransferase